MQHKYIATKVDLHVHSRYSFLSNSKKIPCFLRSFVLRESFSQPELIRKTLEKNGFNYITLTDHDNIEGARQLAEKYPNQCFVSAEITAFFPDKEKTKVHLLTYNITPGQFDSLENLSSNIIELRNYIKKEAIVYSVAHACKSTDINAAGFFHKKQKREILEKLALLFDIFETRNERARHKRNHWLEIYLRKLNPNIITDLYHKHKIEPISDNPWIKGFTGGSDDHCGLFLGDTYTVDPVAPTSFKNFLLHVHTKKTYAAGDFGNIVINFIGYEKIIMKNLYYKVSHRDVQNTSAAYFGT